VAARQNDPAHRSDAVFGESELRPLQESFARGSGETTASDTCSAVKNDGLPVPIAGHREADPTLLSYGQGGAQVLELQKGLKVAGFDPSPLDGVFGDGTRKAVLAFQKANGLKVDGVAGPETKAAIDKNWWANGVLDGQNRGPLFSHEKPFVAFEIHTGPSLRQQYLDGFVKAGKLTDWRVAESDYREAHGLSPSAQLSDSDVAKIRDSLDKSGADPTTKIGAQDISANPRAWSPTGTDAKPTPHDKDLAEKASEGAHVVSEVAHGVKDALDVAKEVSNLPIVRTLAKKAIPVVGVIADGAETVSDVAKSVNHVEEGNVEGAFKDGIEVVGDAFNTVGNFVLPAIIPGIAIKGTTWLLKKVIP
jgi:hypothetical protein